MLIKLYTFSFSFPQCFRSSFHESTGGRMDVHPVAPYNQRINHLGVINLVSLGREFTYIRPQLAFPMESALPESLPGLRDLRSLHVSLAQ